MQEDRIIHSGYLLLPPQGKLVLKKSWQQKYCLLYKASKFGIERVEVFDTIEDSTKNLSTRIITLENCIKISVQSPNIITVVTKSAVMHLATLNSKELNDWITALQSVVFKDNASWVTSIEEDNDLYCSYGEEVFVVRLFPSDASERCKLEAKEYILVLTSSSIQLRDAPDRKILFTWPYCFIRRYGYRDGKFTFEAGRKCDTGEGTFHLEHSNQQEIFRCLSSKMKSMKKILNGESPNTVLDCGDNQFQAALSMEAGSRSPLPPSPTSSTKLRDMDHINSANSTVKLQFLLGETLPDTNGNNLLSIPKSVKPVKPPRKHVPESKENVGISDQSSEHKQNLQLNKEPNYELVLVSAGGCADVETKYDDVELRSEAWRTLGVDDVRHTENSPMSMVDEALNECLKRAEQKMLEARSEDVSMSSSKLVIQSHAETDDEAYDKLNFFGSSTKLNNSARSGYKKIVHPRTIVAATPPSAAGLSPAQPMANSEYDVVEANLQAVRLADDSYLGYGVIRKKPQAEEVAHKVYNDASYAIVSKPKRV